MTNAQIYVHDTARRLHSLKATMSVRELGRQLNDAGIPTTKGTLYKLLGRGLYRLVSTTYAALARMGLSTDADCVAEVFTRDDGTFAYE